MMEETILIPSPNWFQVSVMKITKEGWLIYGGPNKSLCVLEPLQNDQNAVTANSQRYKAHVIFKAHPEKIVSVDLSPEWAMKKNFLTGSADGTVKQWKLEGSGKTTKFTPTLSNEFHYSEKEELTGAGYSLGPFAVSVGVFGNVVKWNLHSNVVQANTHCLKNFKPVCMSCSPHLPLYVAIGTKQGVIFVLDLNGQGKLMYKVRGQDDEIVNISWCPLLKVSIKKTYDESPENTLSFKSDFDETVIGDDESEYGDTVENEDLLTRAVENVESKPSDTIKNTNFKEKPVDDVENECDDKVENEDLQATSVENVEKKPNDKMETNNLKPTENEYDDKCENKDMQEIAAVNILEASGVVKSLPDDSFDEVNVVEDDLFDIYKDHEAEEFGHKKYQPEEILVKIKEPVLESDYLKECLKLKEDILQMKNTEEQTIESLVDAMDKTHVDRDGDDFTPENKIVTPLSKSKQMLATDCHRHKHMLASIGKYGGIRIWSKTGRLVATCAVPVSTGRNQRNKAPNWPTLLWYKADMLLIADGKSQLLECNPLMIDSKNKLEWRVVHTLHKRGLYCVASEAPRIQVPTEDHWPVWTVSQDRSLIKYCMKTRQTLAVYGSCGGYVYNIQPCPYDAGKIAISVGDGAVRVWQTSDEDDTTLHTGKLSVYWQNVQGKVLKLAWHPRKENMLAFSTAEARVGIIDTSGKGEKPAKVLPPALCGGVYSLCWGEGDRLYACGGGELVVYHTTNKDLFPSRVVVSVEGRRWEVSEAQWSARGLVVGSCAGAVAVLHTEHPHALHAAAFIFSKMIYTIEWHPQQISTCNEESPYKNLIAVCSMDKQGNIAILEYEDKQNDTKKLRQFKMLSGHKGPVHDLKWNPHRDAQLLSVSADGTVKIWDVVGGVPSHVVVGSGASILCGAWSIHPHHHNILYTGGGDYSLRLWDIHQHPAEHFDDSQYPASLVKKDKKKTKDRREPKPKDVFIQEPEEQVATTLDTKVKTPKRFLLPTISKHMNSGKIDGARQLFLNYRAKLDGFTEVVEIFDRKIQELEYLKIFGSINDVNKVLDNEMERHMDTGNFEPWMILSVFRGHIDPMIQFASQRDILCPYLLSLAPCVSFKYWKDATQLYLSQIDRLVAKGDEEKLSENRSYGGAVFRKVATLLSVHDVKGAVSTLIEARLYKEAYILCRIRYMDSFADEILKEWASVLDYSGNIMLAAVCYIALQNFSQAAVVLGKSKHPECLSLAAELAKLTGEMMFADHIEKKAQTEAQATSNSPTDETTETENTLLDLPSRAELLINEKEEESESVTIEDSGLEEQTM